MGRERGFTLIEILVVVVIIGLIASLVTPSIWDHAERGRVRIATTKCQNYYNDAKLWHAYTNSYPESLDDMAKPLAEGEENFTEIVDDPWGNPYRLVREGKRIRVWSSGPDGIQGTADDISHPV